MGRSIRSAKSAGTSFETAVCRYYTEKLGREIKRMPKFGANDRGDIDDMVNLGKPLTVECKNPGKNSNYTLPAWWKETLTEQANAGTDQSVLLIRRFGKSDVGQSWCVTSYHMHKILQARVVPLVTHSKPVPKADWESLFDDGRVHIFPRPKHLNSIDDWWVVSTVAVADTYLSFDTL